MRFRRIEETAYFAAEIAATVSAISSLSDAPPTRKPSMSGNAEARARSSRSPSRRTGCGSPWPFVWSTFFAIHVADALVCAGLRRGGVAIDAAKLVNDADRARVSCACSGVAATPVPMAQTGS